MTRKGLLPPDSTEDTETPKRPPNRLVAFIVSGDIYGAFSPNKYLSGYERGRRRKAWRERSWSEWYRGGAVVLKPPVVVRIQVFRWRETDQDNLLSSCKSLIDGLTPKRTGPMMNACLPDDSRKTIQRLTVEGHFGHEWAGKEWVQVFVREVAEEDENPSP